MPRNDLGLIAGVAIQVDTSVSDEHSRLSCPYSLPNDRTLSEGSLLSPEASVVDLGQRSPETLVCLRNGNCTESAGLGLVVCDMARAKTAARCLRTSQSNRPYSNTFVICHERASLPRVRSHSARCCLVITTASGMDGRARLLHSLLTP